MVLPATGRRVFAPEPIVAAALLPARRRSQAGNPNSSDARRRIRCPLLWAAFLGARLLTEEHAQKEDEPMRAPLPWVFLESLLLAGFAFAADPAASAGAGSSAVREPPVSAAGTVPEATHRVRRKLFAVPSPLFIETPTAAQAAAWLRNLRFTPSAAAVVHVMNPYHVQRLLSDSQRSEIHSVGMAGFYANGELKDSTLATLAAQYMIRSALMHAGCLYFSRDLTGPGFWEIVEPERGEFHYEITDLILDAPRRSGGAELMVVQPYASWDQAAAGYASAPENEDMFTSGDYFVLKENTGPGPAFDLEAYEDFLTHLMAHTAQSVWEIGNEVDGGNGGTYSGAAGAAEYVELLQRSRTALGSDVTIVNAGSIGFVTFSEVAAFWPAFFSAGGGALIDALNLHYPGEWYQAASDSSELEELLDFFNGLLAANALAKEIWLTEFVVGDPSLSEQQVAEWYLKRFSFAAARGARKFFVELADSKGKDGLAPLGVSAMFYLEDGAFHAQLMFYTQKLINMKLTGFTGCAELVKDRQYEFAVNGKPVWVLWGAGALPPTLAGRTVKVTDVFGNETVTVSPTLTDRPVFVELVD
jgi:hypothetical protein